MTDPIFCINCKNYNARLERCDRPVGNQQNLVTGATETTHYYFSANFERTHGDGTYQRQGQTIELCGAAGQFFEAKA